jgi:hypothetical protein
MAWLGFYLSWEFGYYIPLEMRNTPSAIARHPIIVIEVMDSLNMSHEKNTVTTYPKLTIGYAMLRLTRERTTSHDNALIPKTAKPAITIGFNSAVKSMDGALVILDILPTFIIPCFSSNCPKAASSTLKNINSISLNISPLSFD